MTNVETRTVDAPGAKITYDVHGDLEPGTRVLMLVGSPMDATGFASLVKQFTDRPVVTYDPRGTGRSPRTEPTTETNPQEHADDLHRVIDALGVGAVDLMGSSGGAVNALALVARHPEQVRTLVAHEPPAAQFLPDREQVLAVCEDIYQTYQRSGMGPAMAKFIGLVTATGPLPEGYADQPGPDPAAFGLPTEDDGSRDDPLLGQNMRTCCPYEHDTTALTAASTRIVIAVGQESINEMAARAGKALADHLGLEAVVFPGHHAGFAGGEFGMQGDPEGFAAALREVLSAGGSAA